MKVRQLTLEQKNLLIGQTWDGVQYFNPTLDANGNWFISNEEYYFCGFLRQQELGIDSWFNTLTEIDYNPVIVDFTPL
jgi:hypothetical protein